MSAALHLVVSCTDRKHAEVPSDLRLRAVQSSSLPDRARVWCARLERHPSAILAARDLYAGDHWAVALTLPDAARQAGYDPCLWVASAGYGLVSSSARLHPYSATFSPGHEDSVGAAGMAAASAASSWWEALATWTGPEPGMPRSLTEVIRSDPQACLLVAGSPSYVHAMSADLERAARTLADPQQLVIISSQLINSPEVKTHLVQVTADAQVRVGGSLGSLHVRVARELLRHGPSAPLSGEAAQAWYARLAEEGAMPKRPAGSRMTDHDVRQFIVDALTRDPKATRTGVLQQLRQTGRACEQKRFARLFDEVRVRGVGAH